jgi:hypothetical protein
MKIAVALATTGRARVLRDTLPTMLAQTRPPSLLLVAGAFEEDVEGIADLDSRIKTLVCGRASSASQRNAAIDALADDNDVVVFFDDDFIPRPDFLERTAELFTARPDVAAASGQTIADGINTSGLSFEEASRQVREDASQDGGTEDFPAPYSINHVYGCNMALRLNAAREVRFDDRLPLYAWQEDRDFSVRVRKHGDVVRWPAMRGVHMGVKKGRTSGVRLGYSQIANPLYFMKKGTMRPLETVNLVGRNVAANLLKSLKPEPWVDRAGRVRGNLIAIADILRGRSAPERVLEL